MIVCRFHGNVLTLQHLSSVGCIVGKTATNQQQDGIVLAHYRKQLIHATE